MSKVRRARGRTKVMWLPKASATALASGCFVQFSSGYIIAAASGTNEGILGVHQGDSYSTADTTTALVPVEVPLEQFVEWEMDVYDSGLTQAVVGTYVDVHTDGAQALASTTTDKVLMPTKRISATKGWFVIAKGAINSFNPSIAIST